MLTVLTLVLTFLCGGLALAQSRSCPERPGPGLWPVGVGASVVGLALASAVRIETVAHVGLALAAGGATVALFDFVRVPGLASSGFALGLAALLVGVTWEPLSLPPAALFAVLAGVGAGAATLAGLGRAGAGMGFAVSAFAGTLASGLGAMGSRDQGVQAGPALLFCGLVGCLVGIGFGRFAPGRSWLGPAAAVATFAVASLALGFRFFFSNEVAAVLGVGVGLSALVALMTPPAEARPKELALAGIGWLGAATLAFSYVQGYGIALLALAGVVAAVVLDHRLALVASAPALALGSFRLFREVNPDTVRAFDIGQHYALVGLLLGALLVIGARELSPRGGSDRARALSIALSGLGLAVAVGVSVVFLGSKGTVGLLIGLGLGPFLAGLAGRAQGGVVSVGVALMALVAVVAPAAQGAMEVGREGKVPILVVGAIVVGACVAAGASLGGRRTEEVAV